MSHVAPAHARRRPSIVALAITLAMALAAGAAATMPAPAAAANPVPACTRGDDPAPHGAYVSWASTLLDTRFRLPRAYVPPGLVSTAKAGTNGGYRVRRLVIADLRALVAGARRAGITIRVASAYRSYAAQARLFAHYVRLLGPVAGARRAARPGHSEHQLGTALDIANTAGAYAWLRRSAWRYGFAVSYPPRQSAVSCYRSEPWHVRYVGRARAAQIRASGLVPRAWLWIHVVAGPG